MAMASLLAIDDIKSVMLTNKVPGEDPTVLYTDTIVVFLSKDTPTSVQGSQVTVHQDTLAETSAFLLPDNITFDGGIAEIATEVCLVNPF